MYLTLIGTGIRTTSGPIRIAVTYDPASGELEHPGDRRGLAHADPHRLRIEATENGFRDAFREGLDELVLLIRGDFLDDFEDALVVHRLANTVGRARVAQIPIHLDVQPNRAPHATLRRRDAQGCRDLDAFE